MKFNNCWSYTIFFLLPCFCSAQSFVGAGKAVDPYQLNIVKEQQYSSGAVVSAHPIASRVGAEVLKMGGNAIDAGIATQLALAVVYPGAGNIGGGGFLVAKMKGAKAIALDYRETAPGKSGRDMYLDANGRAQTDLSQNGHLASGVPGTVAGLFASMKWAKLPFKTLIAPAILLAENGFCLTAGEAEKLNDRAGSFKKYNTVLPVFVQKRWKKGDTLFQKDLAKTLRRISDKGSAGFYEGETARLIVAEMQRGKGVITLNDLKSYRAKERPALIFNYKGHEVITMPPPSSGGVLLMQMLKMVEKRPLAGYGFQTAKSVQLMTEVERRAYADRAEHLGDPDFWKVPVSTITSDRYLAKRMLDYDSTKAGSSAAIGAGTVESLETTHISIMDRWGNMVSITTTLNGTFGSKTVVGGAGFLLNNEMDDFSLKPGVPNMYGAVGGEANAIAPRKRMLSSMSPTILLKNGEPYVVVGTPGGTTIPTSVFQTIINLVDFKMSPADAVNKPKFHHQWLPDELQVEEGFSPEVRKTLEQMGYTVKTYGVTGYASTIGRVELILYDKGKLVAVGDYRGDDSVSGY
ncbi:gamma-glutamyltransferase [Segetibacter sp. 3557_3]|uniref:gamma-glutamyltransferase n=1 Tax=Segetibacter sp. 3557_3 TaxID=2547429 RepID=UPI001058C0BE|nr:gamma-glutamyltransferase [Segetibacter sp. 3557_3]TDH24238.1 gamma-glutamyltransferase [Segetibacter sp. 3557_3]